MSNLRVNNSRLVGLRATADGSLLRTATLHNKEYIVVPIVSAVGDKVWWPANSDVPELVPADVLEAGYWSRNNRPIVAGHPRVNGEYVSANDPKILEEYCYGFTFGSKFEDGRVKVEGWFDPEKAQLVGPLAVNVINKLKNGEKIEVSEGNMVISELKEGEIEGQKYKSVWLSATNDHLATVDLGACSIEMGCGGPRVSEQSKQNEQKVISSLSVASNGEAKMKDQDKKSFFSRLFGSAMTAFKSAMSNNELRMKLYRAVEEVDQGVMYVDDEDVEAKTFRYCVVIRYGDYWDYDQMEHHYYQRSFEIDGDKVKIGDSRVEVEWFEGWKEKVTSQPNETELVASSSEQSTDKPCSCHEGGKEETMLNANEKKSLVTKLIGASKSPFEESDRQILEGMDEKKLTSLVSVYEGEVAITDQPVPVQQPVEAIEPQVSPDQVVISKEEYSDIKAAANAHKARVAEERNSLIASLKSAQSAFTEDDLKGMTTAQLEKLATTLEVNTAATADFSVRGRAESRVNSGPVMRDLPDTWGLGN